MWVDLVPFHRRTWLSEQAPLWKTTFLEREPRGTSGFASGCSFWGESKKKPFSFAGGGGGGNFENTLDLGTIYIDSLVRSRNTLGEKLHLEPKETQPLEYVFCRFEPRPHLIESPVKKYISFGRQKNAAKSLDPKHQRVGSTKDQLRSEDSTHTTWQLGVSVNGKAEDPTFNCSIAAAPSRPPPSSTGTTRTSASTHCRP